MAYDPMVATTKLDAVNQMLMSIGRNPVSTITDSTITAVRIAIEQLDRTVREVLAIGWQFNTDTEYELTVDGSGEIPVPAGLIDLAPCDRLRDITIRDDSGTLKLYDRDEQSFTFAASVEADVIWAFEFEECPEAVRQYIFTRAARRFQKTNVASQVLHEFTKDDEMFAERLARKREGRRRRRNILTHGSNQIVHLRHINPT